MAGAVVRLSHVALTVSCNARQYVIGQGKPPEWQELHKQACPTCCSPSCQQCRLRQGPLHGLSGTWPRTHTHALLGSAADDRMRPLLLIWAAAPAVASVAYLTTFGAQANLQVFILLHWMAVGIFLVLLWCCYRPFMGRIPFDMSIWAAGFPTAALAVSSLTYYQVMPGDLSYGIAVTALAGSSVVNGVLLLQTVAAVIRRRVSACVRGVATPSTGCNCCCCSCDYLSTI